MALCSFSAGLKLYFGVGNSYIVRNCLGKQKQPPNKVIKVTLTSDDETVLGGSHKRFGHLITVRCTAFTLGRLRPAAIFFIFKTLLKD